MLIDQFGNDLGKTAAFLAAVLENLAEGVVACNEHGVLTTFNRATREFHHLPEQPIPSEEWAKHYNLYMADGITPMQEKDVPLYRAFRGEMVRDVEMVIVSEDSRRWVCCNGQPIYDSQGHKLGAVVAMHDITAIKQASEDLKLFNRNLEDRVEARTIELKRSNQDLVNEIKVRENAEVALRESEKRFRTLFEQSPLSKQLLSVDGRTLQVNDAWKKLWGFSDTFIANYILKDYNMLRDPVLEQQGVMKYIQEGFKGNGGKIPAIFYDPLAIGMGEGRGRWVEGLISPILDEQGRVREVVITHQDVTDKVLYENQMKAAKDAAEEANRLKTSFLANMSHEIRTPLGAILGFSELLREPNVDRDDAEKYLEVIDRSGKALTQIIDDILDISKVEAGRLEIESTTVNLNSAITEVVSLLKVQADKRNIEIQIQQGPDLTDHIEVDPMRLRQILINLVGNAVKFTKDGAVKIKVAVVTIESLRKVKISITDTGIGIPEVHHASLFQPFNQIDNSRTRQFGGTGLGLALSKKLAQAMGGDITLEFSREGVGSTFALLLPGDKKRTAIPSSNANIGLAAADDKKPELYNMQILVADDSADNRELVRRVLSKKGAIIVEAFNGAEAVDKALSMKFDIILMDVQMPVMDGLEAIETLRSKGYTIPIISLTAHAMREERDRCLRSGANAHVSKPVQFEVLIKQILDCLKQPKNN